MDDDRVAALISELRARGGRVTSARRALVQAMVDAHGHVTAEDLARRVESAHPDVHLSTIYRSLEALESMGIVDHVHLGHGRAVYHLADDPHQHLVCEVCGAVIEVPDATFAVLKTSLLDDYGFAIRPSHFAVIGRCATCVASGSRGAAGS